MLDITDVIDDEGIALVESLEFLLQDEFGLGPEESLDQQCTQSEVDSPSLQYEFMADGTEQMGLAADRITKGQHVLGTIQKVPCEQRIDAPLHRTG